MDVINTDLQRYAEDHTSAESNLLKRINRDTHAKVMAPRMLSGHLQGRLLSMISKMIRPRRILEIGTYTGYSGICLAEGLTNDGHMTTIDINEELESSVRANFAEAGLSNKITYVIGNASIILPTLTEEFDLVFIDADKENYANYYNMIIDKVKPGGLILADNVLWSGKVLLQKKDKDTRAIVSFNEMIKNDSRVEKVLLPVRDGIFMIRKLSLQNF
ncbi:MAG: O-methyltransferase [Chryseolinea sp.]